MKYKENVFDLIGNTPLLKLKDTNIYVKLECFNLTGSIKDRAVKQMLLTLLEQKKINKDTTIIEATSGNTGISLAAICGYLEMKCIIVMTDDVTKERIDFIEAFGATIIKVKSEEGMKGCIKKAFELNKKIKNSYILDQFNNFDNSSAHYLSTGKEIYEALDGKIDYFVAGIGTGGTISGVGKYLKEKNANIKIIGVEPANSSVIKNNAKGSHSIYGLGAGFIPLILDMGVIDDIYLVDDIEAIKEAKEFCKRQGVLVGISSGAALNVAYKIQEKYGKDKNIVCILPDSGDRYFSFFSQF